jgi:hypothetical protein
VAAEEAVDLTRDGRPWIYSAHALRLLGEVNQEAGDYAQGLSLLHEALSHGHQAGYVRPQILILATLAGLLGTEPGRVVVDRLLAAKLWGAVAAIQVATGLSYSKSKRKLVEQQIAGARIGLDPTAWEAAWTEGTRMTLDEAVELAGQKPSWTALGRS